MAKTKTTTGKGPPKAGASRAPKAAPAPASPRATKGAHLGFRVDGEILALLDERAEQLRAERPGAIVSRSEVAREILYRALKETAKGRK